MKKVYQIVIVNSSLIPCWCPNNMQLFSNASNLQKKLTISELSTGLEDKLRPTTGQSIALTLL